MTLMVVAARAFGAEVILHGDNVSEAEALAQERIASELAGAEPRKVVVVPGRLVNIVK